MQVTVKYTGPMRTLAGRAQDSVSLPAGARLSQLLDVLANTLPSQFVRQVVGPLLTGNVPMALLLVNTVNLPGPAGLDRPLADGDIVAFVPPMAGG